MFEIGAGDCIVHLADHEEHTLRGGPEGLEVLIYGTRHPTELGWLPRSRAIRFGWPWVEGRTDDPWDVEALAEPLRFGEPADRPPTIVNVHDFSEVLRDLARRAGSARTGLRWARLDAGCIGAPPHCHSAEEEVFVVLEGEGILELWPSPRVADRGAQREDLPIRAGHVIARPPATGIGHAFRAGDSGLTLLLYGTREPNDIAYYPRSNKINFRGLGLIGRIEHLDYYDGEPR